MTQMGHSHHVMNFVQSKTPLICSIFPPEEFQVTAMIPAISYCPVYFLLLHFFHCICYSTSHSNLMSSYKICSDKDISEISISYKSSCCHALFFFFSLFLGLHQPAVTPANIIVIRWFFFSCCISKANSNK